MLVPWRVLKTSCVSTGRFESQAHVVVLESESYRCLMQVIVG